MMVLQLSKTYIFNRRVHHGEVGLSNLFKKKSQPVPTGLLSGLGEGLAHDDRKNGLRLRNGLAKILTGNALHLLAANRSQFKKKVSRLIFKYRTCVSEKSSCIPEKSAPYKRVSVGLPGVSIFFIQNNRFYRRQCSMVRDNSAQLLPNLDV